MGQDICLKGLLAPLQLAGSGVSISIAYPPDTDTPGYENEKSLMVRWW
jgi:hypothetical protein